MRARLPVLATVAAVAGCGNVGLRVYDEEAVLGPILEIIPEGEIDFGSSTTDSPSRFQEVMLTSTGDAQVAVIDVYLDEMTSQAFQLVSDDLPLPIRLAPGTEFPVDVAFAPYAVGEFTGTFVVEVDEMGEMLTETRDLFGLGCPPDHPDC